MWYLHNFYAIGVFLRETFWVLQPPDLLDFFETSLDFWWIGLASLTWASFSYTLTGWLTCAIGVFLRETVWVLQPPDLLEFFETSLTFWWIGFASLSWASFSYNLTDWLTYATGVFLCPFTPCLSLYRALSSWYVVFVFRYCVLVETSPFLSWLVVVVVALLDEPCITSHAFLDAAATIRCGRSMGFPLAVFLVFVQAVDVSIMTVLPRLSLQQLWNISASQWACSMSSNHGASASCLFFLCDFFLMHPCIYSSHYFFSPFFLVVGYFFLASYRTVWLLRFFTALRFLCLAIFFCLAFSKIIMFFLLHILLSIWGIFFLYLLLPLSTLRCSGCVYVFCGVFVCFYVLLRCIQLDLYRFSLIFRREFFFPYRYTSLYVGIFFYCTFVLVFSLT